METNTNLIGLFGKIFGSLSTDNSDKNKEEEKKENEGTENEENKENKENKENEETENKEGENSMKDLGEQLGNMADMFKNMDGDMNAENIVGSILSCFVGKEKYEKIKEATKFIKERVSEIDDDVSAKIEEIKNESIEKFGDVVDIKYELQITHK